MTMTMEDALKINERLVETYMIKEGIKDGDVPSLADVSLHQAIEASRMVGKHPGDPRPEGGRRFHCFVEPTRVHLIMAYATFHDRSMPEVT